MSAEPAPSRSSRREWLRHLPSPCPSPPLPPTLIVCLSCKRTLVIMFRCARMSHSSRPQRPGHTTACPLLWRQTLGRPGKACGGTAPPQALRAWCRVDRQHVGRDVLCMRNTGAAFSLGWWRHGAPCHGLGAGGTALSLHPVPSPVLAALQPLSDPGMDIRNRTSASRPGQALAPT